jgi:hypothetical protein
LFFMGLGFLLQFGGSLAFAGLFFWGDIHPNTVTCSGLSNHGL